MAKIKHLQSNSDNRKKQILKVNINRPKSPVKIKRLRLTPDVRKRQILKVAMDMASEVGYLNIQQLPVAKAAAVNPRLVVYYFGGMSKLKQAVMQEAINQEQLDIIAQGLVLHDPIALKAPKIIKQKALKNI